MVIASGRAFHSVTSVMKNASPWVISSKAVTNSPTPSGRPPAATDPTTGGGW